MVWQDVCSRTIPAASNFRSSRLDTAICSWLLSEPSETCYHLYFCKYVLKPNGVRISRHLVEQHGVPKARRQGADKLVWHLGLCDPNCLPLRQDHSPQHEHLILHSGFTCRGCESFHTTSSDLMRRHLSKEYRWAGLQKKIGRWPDALIHSC